MDGWNWRALLIGFAGALAFLGGLLYVVGATSILESLTSADPTLVAMTLAFVLAWLGAWGLLLQTVLKTLGIDLPIGISFFVVGFRYGRLISRVGSPARSVASTNTTSTGSTKRL